MKIAESEVDESSREDDALLLLSQSHDELLQLVAGLSDAELREQYHPDLSPLGWHLGHTAFIERFWIEAQVLGDSTNTAGLADFYLPERNPKSTRPQRLPEKEPLLKYVHECFAFSSQVFPDLLRQPGRHPLLADQYLLYFLVQHNFQHLETMLQVLQQRALREPTDPSPPTMLVARPPSAPEILLDKTDFTIGAKPNPFAYDNELMRHTVTLEPFCIAMEAVSNAEFLNFMESDGYTRREFWSATGWQWQQTAQVRSPLQWVSRASDEWSVVEPRGATALLPEAAVYGINYFEAEAYARFAGGRLPHETEWEYAATHGNLRHGKAWEWCANAFYPYPGFRAYPYDNYSLSWFDGNHFTLRGGSHFTHPLLKRPTFRNFYTPEKRHIFAGLRLAKSI